MTKPKSRAKEVKAWTLKSKADGHLAYQVMKYRKYLLPKYEGYVAVRVSIKEIK